MKPLLPSLKEKKRYVVYEVEGNFNKQEVFREIEKSCLGFLGELGYGKAGIMVLKDIWKNNKGIVRVNNKYTEEVKMALGLIKTINNKKARVQSIGTSGIIDKAKQKFLEVEE